jgi:signal transduction histidine kinase/DNA-binding response OmpR family regulator
MDISGSWVLIVDGELNLVRMSQRVLVSAGYRFISADNPEKALALLDLHPVDVMVVDARLPGLDGCHFLDEARTRRPALGVVIMSGFGGLETAVATTRRGADILLLKPFQEKELVDSVALAYENATYRRDALRLRAVQPVMDVLVLMYSTTDQTDLQTMVVEKVHSYFDSAYTALYQVKGTAGYQLAASQGAVVDLETCLQHLRWNPDHADFISQWGSRDAAFTPELWETMQCLNLVDIICVGAAFHEGAAGLLMFITRCIGQPAYEQFDYDVFIFLARQIAQAMDKAELWSDLRRSLQALEHSQQMMLQVDKMTLIGRLTASIAHEINNPLQGLQNWLELASRRDVPKAERERYIKLGQDELNRLRLTVQQMLDFYRPGLRDKRLMDVNDLARYVVSLMEVQLTRANVRTSLWLQEELPPVMAVSSQIQQVLLNLLLNAMEAMPGGGEIRISTRRAAIQNPGGKERPGVELIVEDSGPGITQLVRDRLFEPFVSTKEDGNGLGLPLCYGIVTAHGGSLDLMPGNGGGACFRIILPEE